MVVAGVLVSGWNVVLWWMVWWVEIVSGWNGVWWMVGWVVGCLNNNFSTPYSKWGRATMMVRSDTHAFFKPCFLGRYR